MQTSGNPRRLKRVVNVFQLAVAYAKRQMDEKDPMQTVYLDPRWPLFALKLVKLIILCEEHPIRMSLLISQVEDAHQKAEVNSVCTSDMFQYLDDQHVPAKPLDSGMLLATFYYKHVDPLYYLQRDCARNLMQDGDPENFAMILSMKLPDEAIKGLPEERPMFDDAGDFDLVVRDLTGQDEALSLLDYALNLSPALRDTITRDVAQNVSAFELRRPTADLSDQRESSVQSKASYLLKPPKAAV
ncbi:unnamed protein product [Pelagomonas calceolata]|uniref:Uncharacterized protein n=1 Tax=Pelagomonas calceolata TaxID=35677 RepID=A0A8J2WWF0_9STRA|nr:unnamed protein product [Pelagomonas calceolata]